MNGLAPDGRVRLVHEAPAIALPYAAVGGVVTGVLLDEHGDPAEGVQVALWQARFEGGRLTLQPTERAPWRRPDERSDRAACRHGDAARADLSCAHRARHRPRRPAARFVCGVGRRIVRGG